MNSATNTMLAEMPEVTQAHRQEAFGRMKWNGWTYEAAMKFDMRKRLVECLAHHIRTQEWMAKTNRSVQHVKRVRLGIDGHPVGWATQIVMGPRVQTIQQNITELLEESCQA